MKNKKPKQESTVDPDADYDENEENYMDQLGDQVDEIMKQDEQAANNAERPAEIDFDNEASDDADEDEEE